MFNVANPSAFTSAILISSTMLIAACTALLVGLVFSKPTSITRLIEKKSIRRKLIYMMFLVSFLFGTVTITFSIIWYTLPIDSPLSSTYLNITWVTFAIQLASFINLVLICLATFYNSNK